MRRTHAGLASPEPTRPLPKPRRAPNSPRAHGLKPSFQDKGTARICAQASASSDDCRPRGSQKGLSVPFMASQILCGAVLTATWQ